MIKRVFYCMTAFAGEENAKKSSKQNGETLGVLNDCLNDDWRIITQEHVKTTLGDEMFYLLHKPDEEPKP